jgi:predicted dehydrogenase/GNAT superfamily N-acetyltransferase
MSKQTLKLGIVGACGRGGSFETVIRAIPGVSVQAVCDIDVEKLPHAARKMGAKERYTDYATMLAKADIEAVLIGTPMPLHVPQAIAALQKNLHVLSEVPAGVSIEECKQLILAVHSSRVVYAMAENYLHTRSNRLITELVRAGLFGETYYAEGEYLHEIGEYLQKTPWRRKWQVGINGNTYPTHSLGPILQWLPGDRVASVSCMGSGRHARDSQDSRYENEDTTLTLCKMKSGALVKLRLDLLSSRPHALMNYQLQGTDGVYESARAPGEADRVWLRALCPDEQTWLPLQSLEDEYLPDEWQRKYEIARQAGHGGGDYFVLLDFVEAIRDRRAPEVDIHSAMDMTLPGLVSQLSIESGGAWLQVPDSREWLSEVSAQPQLQMIFPSERFHLLPEIFLPSDYHLRRIEPTDELSYLGLRERAGFGSWTQEDVRRAMRNALPDGFFVVEYLKTGEIVASAIANHAPGPHHPNAGVLDWVMTDPDHRSKGLGKVVTIAVTRLLIERGYQHIYLLTDDWRVPALKVYLQLGWQPLILSDGMQERWNQIDRSIGNL